MGMNQMMNSGMQPLFSTILLFVFAYIVQIGINKIETSTDIDMLAQFIKHGSVDLQYIEVDRRFFVILVLTLLLELTAQYANSRITNNSQINVVVKGLEKFYKKYNKPLKAHTN
jgi:hypothetical protein